MEYLVGRILRHLGQQVVWFNERDFTASALQVAASPRFDARRASLEECLTAAQDPVMQLTAPFVTTAFAEGAMCHATFSDGQMVAYAWRASKTAPHDTLVGIQISPGVSYGFKAFTHPEYRGLGLYSAITAVEYATCQVSGIRTGVSFTAWDNVASKAADDKLGNTRVGAAAILSFGGRVKCMHSKGALSSGIRFVPVADRSAWPWKQG